MELRVLLQRSFDMDLEQKQPEQKEIFASEHGSGILLEWLN